MYTRIETLLVLHARNKSTDVGLVPQTQVVGVGVKFNLEEETSHIIFKDPYIRLDLEVQRPIAPPQPLWPRGSESIDFFVVLELIG